MQLGEPQSGTARELSSSIVVDFPSSSGVDRWMHSLAHQLPLSFCLISGAATGLGAFEGIDDPLHLLSDMDTVRGWMLVSAKTKCRSRAVKIQRASLGGTLPGTHTDTHTRRGCAPHLACTRNPVCATLSAMCATPLEYLCEAGRSSTHHALASPTSARIVFSNVCRAGSGKRSHFESTLISCARARGKDAAVDDAFRASAVAERHSEHSFRIAPPVPGNQVRFSSRSQQQPLTLPLLCIRPCLSFSLGRVFTSANNAAIDA